MNSQLWPDTKGKEKAAKISKAKLDPIWKNTKGKQAITRLKETVNAPEFANKLKVRGDKISTIQNDPAWLVTMGEVNRAKLRKIKNCPIWKKDNTFTCQHCQKTMVGKGNFIRWHDDNCKFREII